MASHFALQYEQVAHMLMSAIVSCEEALPLLVELREHLDVVHTPEYASFLKTMMPAFVHLLTVRTAPGLENNANHKYVCPLPSLPPSLAQYFGCCCSLLLARTSVCVGVCV
jgi:hypothetical protein